MKPPAVVAVVATLNREREVARLLRSLVPSRELLAGVVVTDNGSNLELARLAIPSGPVVKIARASENLGCGGGLRLAMKEALKSFPALTHFWILDDDVEVSDGALRILLEEMGRSDADAAYPFVIDEGGKIGWFPGLLVSKPWKVIRQVGSPEEYIGRCGAGVVPFSWSPGVALLVSRRAVDDLGFHLDNFWVRGEDLEYSVRITSKYRGIFVPGAVVRHFFAPENTNLRDRTEYLKRCAHVQNAAYISTRLPHARSMLRYLPGNIFRLLHDSGWRVGALRDAFLALWRGAIKGLPAGAPGGAQFKERALRVSR